MPDGKDQRLFESAQWAFLRSKQKFLATLNALAVEARNRHFP